MLKTFRLFSEEVAASSVPANNAMVTKGVDGFTPETLPVRKKDQVKLHRRNSKVGETK